MSNEQALQLALSHHQGGRLAEAEAVYRQVLVQEPNHPIALHLLGALALQAGRLDEAIDLQRQAIAGNPSIAEAHFNLGLCLSASGQWEQASQAYAQAVKLNEKLAVELMRGGDIHNAAGRFNEAAVAYQGLLAGAPPSNTELIAAALNNLGNVLHACHRHADAIAYYQAALMAEPDHAATLTNLGNALEASNRVEEAIAAHRRAIELHPDFAAAYTNLARAIKDRLCLDEVLACYRKAIALQPNLMEAHTGLLLSLHFSPTATPDEIFAAHVQWAAQFAEPLTAAAPPPARHAAPPKKIRIGYVSPDFYTHPIAYFIEPVLRNHDRNRFEVFCYANNAASDALTERLRAAADHWRSIYGVSDVEAVEMVRRDEIDVLVDLAGHTSGTRLLLFARRPAPIQISWLGYQDTTGMSAIDYRITDSICDPPGTTEQWHTEKLLRLPHSFFCYRPPDEAPENVGDLPALQHGNDACVTFASLNNFAKINDPLLAAWGQILQRTPRSRLLVFISDGPAGGQAVMDHFVRHGIAPARLEFVCRQPLADYMAMHQRIDIALDSVPCSGHTTMCHALWMGVPSVTLEGKTYVSRMGVSVLKSVGLPEFIAQGIDDYIDIAAELATNLPRLADLRKSLRGRMKQSPLMDELRFSRDLEALYGGVT